jgi:hypothetical protein
MEINREEVKEEVLKLGNGLGLPLCSLCICFKFCYLCIYWACIYTIPIFLIYFKNK